MNRRHFLALTASTALTGAIPPARAQIVTAELRGSINGVDLGLRPGAIDDQSVTLQAALETAYETGRTLFMPAGEYLVSNISLPPRARITGIAGETVLTYTGAGHLIVGERSELVRLTDLVFDGANRPLGEYVPGIVHLSGVPDAVIAGCHFRGSGGSGIAVDRSGGRITGNIISGAAEAGIRAIESTGLTVTDNVVRDCANNGILIYRWDAGEDGSIVANNRVERIRADNGGTGPYGNGINVFQAHNVTVSNNRIADCAFTAVRANSSDNVAIVGNNCSRLGEVAIFSEFSFEGAVIADNIVDESGSGISVANLNEGGRIAVVSGNVVRNLTGTGPYPPDEPGFGIGIWVEADTAVTGNVIEGAPLAGMWVGWGPYLRNVAVTGNIIREAPIGISVSVVEGAGSAVISGNIIEGAVDGAVIGTRWSEIVTGDLTSQNNRDFSWLSVHGNLIAGIR